MKRPILLCVALMLALGAVATAAPSSETATGSGKVTLKAMIRKQGSVTDFATNKLAMQLEKVSNVRVEWIVLPDADQVRLAFAGGDLPDMMVGWLIGYGTDEMKYASEGLLLPLNDLIAKNAPNFQKLLKELPALGKAITLADGKIYQLPNVAQDNHGYAPTKAWIHKPWLDKLGLKAPTTTEEFYQVLRAFKLNDPNGNGKPDEIPMSGAIKTWNATPDLFLMNPFVLNDGNRRLVINNGVVEFAASKPEWRAGLQYIAKLYKEGLIDPAAFTQDLGQLGQLAENPGTNILGSYAAGHLAMAWALTEGGRAKDAAPILPLQGPSGLRNTVFRGIKVEGKATQSLAAWPAFRIPKGSRYPEIAMRWADYLYSEEGSMWANAGEKGVDWRDAQPGEIGKLAQPAVWTKIVKVVPKEGSMPPENITFEAPSWASERVRLGQTEIKEALMYEVLLSTVSLDYAKFFAKEPFPSMIYTPLESVSELAQIQTAITNLVNQATVRFITGQDSLDTGWDAYVKQLDNLGLKRYVEIYAKAYQTQYK